MKNLLNKIQFFLIITLLIIGVDFIFYLLNSNANSTYIFYTFLISIFIFILLSGLLYKSLFDLNTNKFLLAIYLITFLSFSAHLAYHINTINKVYSGLKPPTTGFQGSVFQFDKTLGHSAKPNSTGAHVYNLNPSATGGFSVYTDSLGYRTTPLKKKLSGYKEVDLFLGCSWTWGDYVVAEKTYSFLTADSIHHNFINAGAPAYGLAQMYQLGEKLISENNFHYIFIQYSPWLSDRAMHINGPTYHGYRPFPYFYKTGTTFKLQEPLYSTSIYKLNGSEFRENERSYLEKLLFFFKVGISLEFIDYYKYIFSSALVKIGVYPEPTTDTSGLEDFVYNQLIELGVKKNAQPVVVKMGFNLEDYNNPAFLTKLDHLKKNAWVVEVDSLLYKNINYNKSNYEKAYAIWHVNGKDSLLIDGHLNETAQKIISSRILETIKINSTN